MGQTKAPQETSSAKSTAQAAQQQPKQPEKQAVPTRVARMPMSQAASNAGGASNDPGDAHRARSMTHMQRSLGNARAGSMMQPPIQTKLTVNTPGDAHEQEADAVARNVVQNEGRKPVQRMHTQQPIQRRTGQGIQLCAECAQRLQRDPNAQLCLSCEAKLQQRSNSHNTPEVTPEIENKINAKRGSGEPIADHVRAPMEQGMGANFSHVRVHNDSTADHLNRSMDSRAFATGSDIFFKQGEYNPGTSGGRELLAHELTHTVQQSAVPTSDIQRDWIDDAKNSSLGKAAGAAVSSATNMAEDAVIATLKVAAPQLMHFVEEIRAAGGLWAYLKRMLTAKLTDAFNALGGSREKPLANLMDVMKTLVQSSDGIIAALQSGDCKPLFNAISQISDALGAIAGEAWNQLVDFLRPVGDFFSNLWKQYGAPFIDWVKNQAGGLWENVKSLANQLWSWMKPIYEDYKTAWKWIKEALGIGDDPDSQNGLLQWFTAQLTQIWDEVKVILKPVIDPMRELASQIIKLLPLDTILDLRKKVTAWLKGQQNFVQNMTAEGEQPGVVENRETLRNEILPAILKTIGNVRNGLIGAGQWIAVNIGQLGARVTGFINALRTNAYLSPAADILAWVETAVGEVVNWAQTHVATLFTKLGDALVFASQFISPILDTLEKLASALGNLLGALGDLVMGSAWKKIPACIIDPIKNFIVNQILKNIPIFSQLMEIPDLWQKLSQTAMRILRLVFVDGNLAKAAWLFFKEMLSLLGIPPKLVVEIITKTLAVFTDIITNPVSFFKNLLQSIKKGFSNFYDNIWTHLLTGVLDWLFGQVADAGISRPKDFSLGSIFKLVMEVLGISYQKIMEKIDRKNPEMGKKIRAGIGLLEKAWHWVSILIEKGPEGVWEEIKTQVGNVKDMVIQSVTGWITNVVIEKAITKLITSLDPSGIGAVVNSIISIYQAIQAAVAYINDMLNIVNKVLDGIGSIIKGDIEPGAKAVETALAKAIPVAIGFLAYQVGLGKIGKKIREAIEGVRAKVDKGIDSLIDKGLKAIGGIAKAFGISDKKVRIGEFKDKKEGHEIFIDSSSNDPQIEIHSTHVIKGNAAHFEEELKKLTELEGSKDKISTENLKDIHRAREIINKLLSDAKKQHSKSDMSGSQPESSVTPDNKLVLELQETLSRIYGLLSHITPPDAGKINNSVDNSGRPTKAWGWLKKPEGDRKPGDETSVSSPVNKLMTELGLSTKFAGGHIIAHRYGGKDTAENIVPQEVSSNGSWYKTFENIVAEHLKNVKEGELIYAEVEVKYPSDEIKDIVRDIIDLESVKTASPDTQERMKVILRKVPLTILWRKLSKRLADGKETDLPVKLGLFDTRKNMPSLGKIVTKGSIVIIEGHERPDSGRDVFEK